MIQFLLNYICGYLTIEIIGDSPERFVNMCVHHGIKLWDFRVKGNLYRFKISLKNISELEKFSSKTGIKYKLVNKAGFPVILDKFRARPLFLPGLMLTIICIYICTFFIWNINIEGNSRYSEYEIIRFLNEQNIYRTMAKSKVNTGDVAFMIRSHFGEVIWVSVHVDGSSLNVKIKENNQVNDTQGIVSVIQESKDTQINEGYDIVAEEAGVISSIITRLGVPLVHVGDRVEKGDILVSGRITLLDDYGEIIDYNYVKADGEIIIETKEEYTDNIGVEIQEKVYNEDYNYNIYLKIGDYYIESDINFNNRYSSLIQRKEYSIHPTQQNKYTLVFGIIKECEYKVTTRKLSESEIQDTLTKRFNEYISEIHQKGVEIIENNVTIVIKDDEAVASGMLKKNIMNSKIEATEVLDLEINPTEIED